VLECCEPPSQQREGEMKNATTSPFVDLPKNGYAGGGEEEKIRVRSLPSCLHQQEWKTVSLGFRIFIFPHLFSFFPGLKRVRRVKKKKKKKKKKTATARATCKAHVQGPRTRPMCNDSCAMPS
jgi:hypothetical protein